VNHVFVAKDLAYARFFLDEALSDKLEDLLGHVQHLLLSYFDVNIHFCLCVIVVQINLLPLIITVVF